MQSLSQYHTVSTIIFQICGLILILSNPSRPQGNNSATSNGPVGIWLRACILFSIILKASGVRNVLHNPNLWRDKLHIFRHSKDLRFRALAYALVTGSGVGNKTLRITFSQFEISICTLVWSVSWISRYSKASKTSLCHYHNRRSFPNDQKLLGCNLCFCDSSWFVYLTQWS